MLRTLLYNTGSNVAVLFVRIVATFVMTPVFVHNLGRYDYGLWEMIAAIIGYMGLLDLGMRPAVSRYAAKYKAEENREELLRVYASVFVFFTLVGVLLAMFLVCWGVWFGYTLAPDGASDAQKYSILLFIIALQMLMVFPGYVAEGYIEGFQKYYVKNAISIVFMVVMYTFLYVYISPENGLLLLAATSVLGLILKYLIYMGLLARPAYGAIRLKLSCFRWSTLKELIQFGFKSFVQGVAARVEGATDTLLIGFFLGPSMVPLYSIPQNLVRYMQSLGMTLSHAFMPLFSDLSARRQEERIQQVYLVASKVVAGLVSAMGVGAVLVGGPFLGLWIGEEFSEKADIIILLLVLFIGLPMLNPFSSRYLTAIGRHGMLAKILPATALVNVVLSIILVHQMGIVGVALGSVIPVLVAVPVIMQYTCRHLGISVGTYLRRCIAPILIPLSLMGGAVGGIRVWTGIPGYTTLAGAVLAGAAIYAVTFWWLSFTGEERRFILERIPLGRRS